MKCIDPYVADECCGAECEYYGEKCRLKEMEEIVTKINQVFPNVCCYVDGGSLQIEFTIRDNFNNAGPFNNANSFVMLSPKNGGIAEMYADIYPIEGGAVGPYLLGNEIQFPKQKWMINPECILW